MNPITWLRLTVNRIALTVLRFPSPYLLTGPSSSRSLCRMIGAEGHQRVLFVTDQPILDLGLLSPLRKELKQAGVETDVFSDVIPDPDFAVIEAGIEKIKAFDADAVLAVGGGSVIDCAKAMLLSHGNDASPRDLLGIWLYAMPRKRGLPFYVVPTTAGTGSEATVAAVVSDTQAQSKRTMIDPKLVPDLAALDPRITVKLPAHITAATGVDALTHAVEAYISTLSTSETDALARRAATMIFRTLPKACEDGSDLVAREAMLIASNLAGMAFTRAGVGYVHAFAHQIGGLYHVPHGVANAVLLPHVLEMSKDACTRELAELASACGLSEDRAGVMGQPAQADAFIAAIRAQNSALGLPDHFEALKRSDFDTITSRAFSEAHGTYGVPRYFTKDDAVRLLEAVMAPQA